MIRSLCIALVALTACKGSKPLATQPQPEPDTRPAWVRERPNSSMYFIGVGLAMKSRPDHQETAKKNALNDLASEISVVVEGNSLLYSLDQRTRFDETFTSTIRTRTSEQLEGFELVDTWENANEYWMYYRLSKSEHARIKAERKARAIDNATDLHQRGKASLAQGDLRGAFDMQLRALLAVRDHWGESDMVELDGRRVPLANELFAELQRLTSGIQLGILPDRCELNYAGGFRREMLISAKHTSDRGTRDLAQLPLVITWPGNGTRTTELKSTDATGHVRSTVQRVNIDASPRELVVRLDLDALVSKELDPTFTRPVVASLTVPEKHVPIDIVLPRVLLRSNESNLGSPVQEGGLALVLREEFTKRGFRFVEREADADLVLQVDCTTRQGGEASGFFTTFLDASFSFRDRRSGDVVHQGGRQGVKGVQLDYQRAGMDAYRRAVDEIRRDVVPQMLKAML